MRSLSARFVFSESKQGTRNHKPRRGRERKKNGNGSPGVISTAQKFSAQVFVQRFHVWETKRRREKETLFILLSARTVRASTLLISLSDSSWDAVWAEKNTRYGLCSVSKKILFGAYGWPHSLPFFRAMKAVVHVTSVRVCVRGYSSQMGIYAPCSATYPRGSIVLVREEAQANEICEVCYKNIDH